MKRPLTRGWRIAGAALLLLAGGIALQWWRSQAEREALREEILAEVEARRGREEEPAPVPEGENAAPLYTEAFAALDRSACGPPFLAALGGDWTVPPPALESALAANRAALDMFEAALRIPGMEADAATVTSWGSGPYDMVRLLQARLLLRARKGRTGEALEDATRLALVVRHLSRIPRYQYFLHAEVILGRCFEAFQEAALDPALEHGAAVRAVGALLSPAEARAAYARAVRAAYRDGLDGILLRMLAPDAEERMARSRGGTPPSFLDRVEARLRGRPLRPGWDLPLPPSEMRLLRGLSAEFLDAVGEDGPGGLRRLESFEGRLGTLAPGEFARGFLKGTVATLRAEHMLEARLGAARTALALRAHAIREGRPARSLEDLVPGLLDSIPASPFSGEPFSYEVTEEGWTLACPIPPEFREKDTMIGLEWKRPR